MVNNNLNRTDRDLLIRIDERTEANTRAQNKMLEDFQEWKAAHEKATSARFAAIHKRVDRMHTYGRGISLVSSLLSSFATIMATKFLGIKVD